MANVLRNHGYSAAGDKDDEFAVFRDGEHLPYSIDVIGSNGTRVLAVEINGPKNHGRTRNILKDFHRANEIRSLIKDVEVYSFEFFQLAKCPDQLIAEELGLVK